MVSVADLEKLKKGKQKELDQAEKEREARRTKNSTRARNRERAEAIRFTQSRLIGETIIELQEAGELQPNVIASIAGLLARRKVKPYNWDLLEEIFGKAVSAEGGAACSASNSTNSAMPSMPAAGKT